MMRIVTIGSGYVGLVSGACLADFGHQVICVDSDAGKIAALQAGTVPFYEPGLDDLAMQNAKHGRLQFTTGLDGAVAGADAVFIAVGTPARKSDGHADLSAVYGAARQIARAIRKFTVVISKSTVPLGTCDEIERIIREENPQADFAVVSNPEFLREGAAIADFNHPDRIVVGLVDDRARQVMNDIYQSLLNNNVPMLFTTRRAAELIKYAANAFLAVKITYINEIADLCEQAGADVGDVARGMSSVLGLKVSPKMAMVLPRTDPPQAAMTLRAMPRLRCSLIATVVSTMRKGRLKSWAVLIRASVSLGKHEPP